MVLGQLGLDIGPAVAGSRRRRDRRRVRGAVPRPRLPQRRADPDREPVRPGRRRAHRGRRGDRRGLHAAADDAARPRWRRPHRPQRRDPRGLEPDPRLVAHQPGRHGRLRHRHRRGDRGRRRGRARDGRRSGLEAAGPRGAARRADQRAGRDRGDPQDPRDRPRGRPVGRRRATSAGACSTRSRPAASRSPDRWATSRSPTPREARPAARHPTRTTSPRARSRASRRFADRPSRHAARTDGVRWLGQSIVEKRGFRERRAAPFVA